VDSVAGLLDGPRARDAFLLRTVVDPPWAIRVQDGAPLTLVAVVRGAACVVAGEAVHRLAAGDVAIVRGPEPYLVADDPATAPQVVIHPGQRCTAPDGSDASPARELGVRTWGTTPDGATVLLTGTYQLHSETSRRLLDALAPVLVLPAADAPHPLVPYLAEEVVREEPGQEAVLDRLLDLLLVAVLRAWFARAGGGAPGWYRAQADPVVGPALRLLQRDPAHPWTVAALARAVGVSRAGLAAQFTALVGEPPMTFLTAWRLTLAADLLREPGATVGSVAPQVGYGSAFALSTAFKRVRGVSPTAFRSGRGTAST
jgi:AraC-like DNA-binding protein